MAVMKKFLKLYKWLGLMRGIKVNKYINMMMVVLLLAVSACGSNKNDKRIVTRAIPVTMHGPSANEIFAQELSLKFNDYAMVQREQRDWKDYDLFLYKSERLATGIIVDPNHPQDWDIRIGELDTLRNARRELLNTVSNIVVEKDPKASANAYFLYDCWIDQEENWLDDDRISCREEFFRVIDYLSILKEEKNHNDLSNDLMYLEDQKEGHPPMLRHDIIHRPMEKKTEIRMAHPEVKLEPVPEETKPMEKQHILPKAEEESETEIAEISQTVENEEEEEQPVDIFSAENNYGMNFKNHVVFFASNQSYLTDLAKGVIKKISDGLNKDISSIFILNGHADKYGTEEFNLELSELRAEAVSKEFRKLGVRGRHIQSYGFGEARPVVPTKDGIKHPANRRVEIFVE